MEKTIKHIIFTVVFILAFFIMPTALASENTISIEYFEKDEDTLDNRPIEGCVFGLIRVSEDLSLSKDEQEELFMQVAGLPIEEVLAAYKNLGELIELSPTDKNGRVKASLEKPGLYYVFELDKRHNHPALAKRTNPFLAAVAESLDMTINPKPIAPEKTQVSVRKVWEGKKLKEIEVKLLADGHEVDRVLLNESNKWKFTFAGLNLKDEDDRQIAYTVEEIVPKGYTSKIEKESDPNSFVITNKLIPTGKIIETGDISHLYFLGGACILIATGYRIYKKED